MPFFTACWYSSPVLFWSSSMSCLLALTTVFESALLLVRPPLSLALTWVPPPPAALLDTSTTLASGKSDFSGFRALVASALVS